MFQFIGFAIKYLPVVIAAVQMVEGIVSKETTGETKRELATKFVIDTVGRLGVKVSPSLREVIGQVIDLAVTILNFFGVFAHAGEVEEGEDVRVVEETPAPTPTPTVSPNDARIAELERALKR